MLSPLGALFAISTDRFHGFRAGHRFPNFACAFFRRCGLLENPFPLDAVEAHQAVGRLRNRFSLGTKIQSIEADANQFLASIGLTDHELRFEQLRNRME